MRLTFSFNRMYKFSFNNLREHLSALFAFTVPQNILSTSYMQNNAISTGGIYIYISRSWKYRNVSCMHFKYYITIHNKIISFFSYTLCSWADRQISIIKKCKNSRLYRVKCLIGKITFDIWKKCGIGKFLQAKKRR